MSLVANTSLFSRYVSYGLRDICSFKIYFDKLIVIEGGELGRRPSWEGIGAQSVQVETSQFSIFYTHFIVVYVFSV